MSGLLFGPISVLKANSAYRDYSKEETPHSFGLNTSMDSHTRPLLIENIVRSSIYDSAYWRTTCITLSAASLIEEAVQLQFVAGQVQSRPSSFVCLLLKLLHLEPEREIISLYLECEHKYLVALAAFYVRLTYPPTEVYSTLEPLLLDYRKLRFQSNSGDYRIMNMDSYIDDLLHNDRVSSLILPRLPKRYILENNGKINPRVSPLEFELNLDFDL